MSVSVTHRCVGLSSLGIYLYTELCRGVVSSKLSEAVSVILGSLQVENRFDLWPAQLNNV